MNKELIRSALKVSIDALNTYGKHPVIEATIKSALLELDEDTPDTNPINGILDDNEIKHYYLPPDSII